MVRLVKPILCNHGKWRLGLELGAWFSGVRGIHIWIPQEMLNNVFRWMTFWIISNNYLAEPSAFQNVPTMFCREFERDPSFDPLWGIRPPSVRCTAIQIKFWCTNWYTWQVVTSQQMWQVITSEHTWQVRTRVNRLWSFTRSYLSKRVHVFRLHFLLWIGINGLQQLRTDVLPHR